MLYSILLYFGPCHWLLWLNIYDKKKIQIFNQVQTPKTSIFRGYLMSFLCPCCFFIRSKKLQTLYSNLYYSSHQRWQMFFKLQLVRQRRLKCLFFFTMALMHANPLRRILAIVLLLNVPSPLQMNYSYVVVTAILPLPEMFNNWSWLPTRQWIKV